MKAKRWWTVVGYYLDNDDRWGAHVRAWSADEAERRVFVRKRRTTEVAIVAVYRGRLRAQESYTRVRRPGEGDPPAG